MSRIIEVENCDACPYREEYLEIGQNREYCWDGVLYICTHWKARKNNTYQVAFCYNKAENLDKLKCFFKKEFRAGIIYSTKHMKTIIHPNCPLKTKEQFIKKNIVKIPCPSKEKIIETLSEDMEKKISK